MQATEDLYAALDARQQLFAALPGGGEGSDILAAASLAESEVLLARPSSCSIARTSLASTFIRPLTFGRLPAKPHFQCILVSTPGSFAA